MQEPTLEVQLRRWWSRRYGRPPNDPLYGDETQTYWLTEFYRDCLEEAYALKDQIEQMPSGNSSKAAVALRGRMLARFRALQAILKGEDVSPVDDRLARDIEAQKRGELPEFMRRKMGQGPATMGGDRAGAPEGGQMPEFLRKKAGGRQRKGPKGPPRGV